MQVIPNSFEALTRFDLNIIYIIVMHSDVGYTSSHIQISISMLIIGNNVRSHRT